MPVPNFQQEVRLGLVLYGGVSLCIYINGVVQELLRLVRSSAPDGGRMMADAPGGTEAVYRKLSQLLNTPGMSAAGPQADPDPQADVHTKFVIDLISGSSAGGINGVFLAKALVLEKGLDDLKRLWVQEGDIELLINDKISTPPGLPVQDPPKSILNGQRMFAKLLEAMRAMDAAPVPQVSRLAEEIDLYATATDLNGLLVPIQLAGKMVFERQHRAVFRFRYAPDQGVNHFGAPYTPLLSYAARCTSSFPAAFEPMKLTLADPLLPENESAADRWKQVAEAYDAPLTHTGMPVPQQAALPQRPFADGGDLDNKPFGFVVEEMVKRPSALPVDRKLIYVEPSPEQPERDATGLREFDAVQNAWAGLSGLPRQETIREDIAKVQQRNREVERLRRLTADIDRVAGTLKSSGTLQPLTGTTWMKLDTPAIAARYGRAGVVYRQLRVSLVTDELVALMCAHFGMPVDSAYGLVIRSVIRRWRREQYEKPVAGQADRLNLFLYHFDSAYRMRRLRHVRRVAAESPDPDVRRVIAEMNELYRNLRRIEAKPAGLVELGTGQDLVKALCGMDLSKANHETNADQLWNTYKDWIYEAAKVIRKHYGDAFRQERKVMDTILPRSGGGPRAQIRQEYDGFESRDSIVLPVMHNTGLSEPDIVEVVRISPLDVERPVALKGDQLGHFGGFFDRDWRVHDIVQGRLDGAECLINALWPAAWNQDMRRRYIQEAREAIIVEELAQRPEIIAVNAARPLTADEMLTLFNANLRKEPQRDLVARSLTRSTTILGRVLEEIAVSGKFSSVAPRYLARFGSFGAGIVELAMPRSIFQILFRHWIKLVYLLEAAMIGLGFFNSEVQMLGLKALAWTAGIHLAVRLTGDWLTGSRAWIAALKAVAAITVALGVLSVPLWWRQTEVWLRAVFSGAGGGAASPYTVVLLTGLAGLAAVVIGSLMTGEKERLVYPPGPRPKQPVLDLEFVTTPGEVDQLAGGLGHPNRAVFAGIQRLDNLFIGAYLLAFFGLSRILIWWDDPVWGAWDTARLGWIVALFGAGAALFDWIENSRMNQILGASLADLPSAPGGNDLRSSPAIPATLKWGLSSAALLASGIGLATHLGWWNGLPGLVLALGGLAGLAGSLTRNKKLIGLGAALMGAGLFLTTAWLLAFPGVFAESSPL
ncbi:MAG: patatin-like protein [Acidobacteria bacterium]|nr:patatin-like protein [Acidobacteriota bacterium]